MKKLSPLLCGSTLFLLFALLRYPEAMLTASADAVTLWLTRLFPSLFPFLAACGILLRIGAAEHMGTFFRPLMRPLFGLNGIAAFPFFLGLLSGYPMGAKITASLYEKKLLSINEAQHILAFCNNPGPLFLIGTIGVSFFGMPFLGYVLLLCSALGAVCTGLLWRFRKKSFAFSTSSPALPTAAESPLSALSNAVTDAVNTILQIGGFLIFFAALTEALEQTGIFILLSRLLFFLPLTKEALQGICGGLLEMTNGAYLLSLCKDPLPLRLIAVMFLVSFSGCSILGQTFGILSNVPISKKDYLKGKCCHALFSSLFFAVLYPFWEQNNKKAVPVFSFFTETAFTVSFLWLLPSLFFCISVFYAFCRKN